MRYLVLSVLLSAPLAAWADGDTPTATSADSKPLLDMSADFAGQGVTASSPQVTFAPSQDASSPGMTITIAPGAAGYPGINIVPAGGKLDLSAYGHIEINFVNSGTKLISLGARIDNAGDWQTSPWNTENVRILPGKAKTMDIYFGYSYGHQPGYALNPAAITQIKIFANKSADEQSLRIASIVAAGKAGEKPAIDPETVRTKPDNGILLGSGATIDATKQITGTGGAKASLSADAQSIEATFKATPGNETVLLKPAIGRWDLRDYLEVHVKVKNTGQTPVTPNASLNSNGGLTDVVSTSAPLAPGEEKEITVSFLPAKPWQGPPGDGTKASLYHGLPGTGTTFSNDAVSAVVVSADHADGEKSLLVESVTADVPPPPSTPEWLGKRPPVDGAWKQTFDEEFDGNAIDAAKWNVDGPNYYDSRTHFSKEEIVLGGGVAKIRYEKKTGFQNDDPAGKQTDYATGFLDTYGKWVQRYGYFEARMKLPTAPGLWPAFWMMPDRGVAAGPQSKRSSTSDGAMEMDIMEYLSRWGPFRYNIAMHWDGYGKNHRSTGTSTNYVQPDKDGFITAGLLWTPGSVIYYCNGREILRWEDPRVSTVPSYMMFTQPSGGWDNNALDDKQLPSDFVVDYVRAWQRTDLASEADGFRTPPPDSATAAAK